VIFQAAFDAAGIEATYEPWKTAPDELQSRVESLHDGDVLGANVTIPHKEAIVPLLDRIDERAAPVGAVNTVVNEDGKLAGYNTDVAGFMRSLREDAGFDPEGKRVAILGGGGAARAVAHALVEARAARVLLTGRSPRKLDAIVAGLRGLQLAGTMSTWAHWGDGVFLTFLPAADILVNATPVGTAGTDTEGQSPIEPQHLPASGIVLDLVYNPSETPLLRDAKARGARTVSGLGMLVYQAAESFRLWTGQDADTGRMFAAGREALGAGTPA
jgi:shikimate dehydrogenase